VNSLPETERAALLDAKGKEMSVKGTISVFKTKVQSTPKVIVENQPLPCQVIQS
jgi:hypothetical protein